MFKFLAKTPTEGQGTLSCRRVFPRHLLHRITTFVVPTFAVLISQTLYSTSLKAKSSDRPNIVLIFTDDQGVNDVGCYGSEIATPHIDALATEGLKFNQFYAASSICTPSRFGLLTGRYAHRSQDSLTSALMFLEEVDAHRGIRAHENTFATQLKSSGYQTALIGKWHLGHGEETFWPTEHGFDTFFGHTGGCVDFFTLNYANRPDWYRGRQLVETDAYATDVITDEAIRVLQNQGQDAPPLFLQISYNAPHFGKGWNAEKEKPQNIMQPKPADLQKVQHIADPLRRAFAAKVVGMDQSIGRLMQTLKDSKLRDNTLVIFMTDHGGDPRYGGSNQPLRGDKATLFEGGIRVPCLVRWPGVVAAGTQTDAVTCAIDWFATLGEIVGFDAPKTDGQSMLPILRGEATKQTQSRTLVWKTGAHRSLARKSWLAVRSGDWKLVQPPGGGSANKQADNTPMLFNLKNDPNEKRNVAKEHADVVKRLLAIGQES